MGAGFPKDLKARCNAVFFAVEIVVERRGLGRPNVGIRSGLSIWETRSQKTSRGSLLIHNG
jgi:hypothetical protein